MHAKKRFGQHFLTDPHYVRRIIEAVDPAPGERLIEIGPGRGALTGALAAKSRPMTAVEVDRDLIDGLRSIALAHPHLQVVQGDILELDWAALAGNSLPCLAVGNLPYNIASLILLRFCREHRRFRSAFVMVQREVGARLTALPSTADYSFLSVAVQTFSRPRRLFTLPPGVFSPPPKVESSFLRLDFPAVPAPPADPDSFFKLVTLAFSQRRKKVVNRLVSGYPEDRVRGFWTSRGLDPNLRAENLSVAGYRDLYMALHG